jgi:hypothetical protein
MVTISDQATMPLPTLFEMAVFEGGKRCIASAGLTNPGRVFTLVEQVHCQLGPEGAATLNPARIYSDLPRITHLQAI